MLIQIQNDIDTFDFQESKFREGREGHKQSPHRGRSGHTYTGEYR